MLTESEVAKIDQKNVYQVYENWPEHFAKAAELGFRSRYDTESYDSIAFCGMGGSAAAGDIINDFLQISSFTPSTVVKGQTIPSFIGKKSLVIVSSVSGNTQETISMAKEAYSRGAEIVCISAGGKLQSFCDENNIEHLQIPNLGLPRASLPYLIMPCLNLFKNSKCMKVDYQAIFADLTEIRKNLLISSLEKNNPARKISNFFSTGFAICFTSPYLMSSGKRFKDSLNENAKVHCLKESVLEASHNEIVPFTYAPQTNPRVLLLSWVKDPVIVKERFNKLGLLFQKISQPFLEITAFENNLINAILSSIYLLDFSTIYMAVSRGIDPSPTPAIDILKSL